MPSLSGRRQQSAVTVADVPFERYDVALHQRADATRVPVRLGMAARHVPGQVAATGQQASAHFARVRSLDGGTARTAVRVQPISTMVSQMRRPDPGGREPLSATGHRARQPAVRAVRPAYVQPVHGVVRKPNLTLPALCPRRPIPVHVQQSRRNPRKVHVDVEN